MTLNNLLQLKGRFEQASSPNRPGSPNLPAGKSVEVSKLENLLTNLNELQRYWQNQNLLPGALITAHYNKIAAKTKKTTALKIPLAIIFDVIIFIYFDDKDIKKQFGLTYRYFGVFLENGKWKKLLSHPILTVGMYFLRFLVGVSFLINKK